MAKHTKTKPNNPTSSSLGPKKTISTKTKKKSKNNDRIARDVVVNEQKQLKHKKKITKSKKKNDVDLTGGGGPTGAAAEQLRFFIYQNKHSKRNILSSLELESLTEKCMLELQQDAVQSTGNLGEYMKSAFGKSWREVFCENQVQEGKVEPGNPALLVVSSSAIRALELLRELRPLTAECKPAKLFAKHMKIEEQVSFLKNRINVASGTPSRIKKLIDMEVLGLSRLSMMIVDLHTDVKGYSLLTLPQVRDEFWEMYRSCFHQRVLDGDMRICLYGPLPEVETSSDEEDEEE